MRKLVLLFTLAAFCFMAKAENPNFKKGDMVANIGLGFGWYNGYNFYGWGYNQTPFINLNAERGIMEFDFGGTLGIGGLIGLKHYSYKAIDYSFNNFVVAGKGSLHYDLLKVDKLDTYAGAYIGVRFATDNIPDGWSGYDSGVDPVFAPFAGARYALTDNIGGFAEFCYGLSYLNLGISFKF